MDNKSYHILSLEAKDIFKHQQQHGVEKGFVLPDQKDYKYYKLFKNVLDDSLDTRELEKCYASKYRNTRFSFKDEHDNNYTLSVVNLKFSRKYKEEDNEIDLKQLRKYFYENGFNIDGIHYVRYKRSSGSSRQGKCLFIDEKLYNDMAKWGECGLKPSSDLASWEAYKSLSLSSIKGTIDIPLDGILFIPDYKSKFTEEVVSVEEKDGTLFASTKKTTIKNDIWDGESLLDESLFVDTYANKHMLLLRNKFFKSCAFKTKLQQWFRDKNITLDDLKAKGFVTLATNINQIVMVTTPSSMKFLKFMGDKLSQANVAKWSNEVDSTFGVVKYDKRTKYFGGKMVQSSYQLINTLGLTQDQAAELIKPSEDYLGTLRSDYDFMKYHFDVATKGEKDDEEDYVVDGLAERSDVIFKLMHVNYGFGDTLLYSNFRNNVVKSQKDKFKQGHLLLPGTNATLFGNGPEMLMALSGEFDFDSTQNSSRVLGKGEIACAKFAHGQQLVCARSPHITMGNLYCATNNLSSDIWKYFDLGENVVCVNAINENIQQRLNGCDYDSDSMLITEDQLIVDTAFKLKDVFKVPVCDIKPADKEKPDLFELDYNTSENKIGEIVNLSQRLNSIIWDKINNGADYESIQGDYENVCKLAVLSGIEIDKAKRAYGNVNVTDELNRLSKQYGKVRPKFFKEMDKDEVDRQVKNVWDTDKTKQTQLRKEKRNQLRNKKEYDWHDTAMEYVYKLASKIDYRKGKDKTKEYCSILDMIVEPKCESSNAYKKRKAIVDLCEKCKKELDALYAEIRNADDDEKDVIYNRIIKLKKVRNDQVKELLTEKYVLYIVLKELEKSTGENWHLYAPLLQSDMFIQMLNASQEKMQNVVETPDGEFSLYGLKFTKL